MSRYHLQALLAAVGLGSLCLALGARERPSTLSENAQYGADPVLPHPKTSWLPRVNIAEAIGWRDGQRPRPAENFEVSAFATDLSHPRWLYALPNGDILVAESDAPPKPRGLSRGLSGWIETLIMKRAGSHQPSANRITLLRDADGDGTAEIRSIFLDNLLSPFGMALIGDELYVANADALMRFPYQADAIRIEAKGIKVADLPSGRNHHWTKSLLANEDGSKLYVGVGSNSNIGENGMEEEENRAAILEIDPRIGTSRLFASGLRNPVGMDWNPETGTLWVAVNERDELGNDLVPDYLTSVKEGGFYGWPYSYWGQIVDIRVTPQRPDLVMKAIKPDYALGSHTASLGLTFVPQTGLGKGFEDGAIIGQHGSWNRKPRAGYRVIFIPFKSGHPSGPPAEILTGFLNKKGQAMGRPVGVLIDKRGQLLVADDVGNTIWRVSATVPHRV